MIYKMICPLCGNEFTSTRGNARYCSDECRAVAARSRIVRYRASDAFREWNRQYSKEYKKGLRRRSF